MATGMSAIRPQDDDKPKKRNLKVLPKDISHDDLDKVMEEVHRSNMSKLDQSGKPLIREDGKVIKSDQYFPPDVAGILKLQLPLPL